MYPESSQGQGCLVQSLIAIIHWLKVPRREQVITTTTSTLEAMRLFSTRRQVAAKRSLW
jgi:hypothetical protein